MTVDKNPLSWSLKECCTSNDVNGTGQETQWMEDIIMNKILLVIKVFAMTN